MRMVLEPLLVTVILECAAAFCLGIRDSKRLYLIVIVNCITNPLLVLCSLFLMTLMGIQAGTVMTYAILEPLVIVAEYDLFRKKMNSGIHPLVLSLILNLVSIIGGIVWGALF